MAEKKNNAGSSYEDWTVDTLQGRAREVGTEGRSSMNKSALTKTLRNQ